MRIAAFADLHLGVGTYGTIDPITNLNTRVINALKSLDEMISHVIKSNIKVVVFAGDAYKNSLVPSTITTEFNKRMQILTNHGVKVLILDGNHDVDKIETKKSPLVSFSDFQVPNAIQTRFNKEIKLTVDGETIKFVFLPTYHIQEEIEEIVNNTVYDGVPIVYIFHGTIAGAALNDWNVAEKETHVDASVFDKPGVAAVIMGHLHRHQVLYNSPLVFYTGSLQRVDFSEENQEKGFVVMEVNQDSSVNYDFIEVESQKFLTIDLDLVGKTMETDLIVDELDHFKKKVKNAIVRIRIDVDKANSINETRIYEHAYKLGAQNILDIQKRFEKRKNKRDSNLTEYIDENSALELYYQGRENSDKLIEMGLKIIDFAKKEGKI